MLSIRSDGTLAVHAEAYTLTFANDRPFVYLDDAAGTRLAELFALSSIHPLHDRDDTTGFGAWQLEESAEELVVWLQAESSVWRGKTYRFRCLPHRFVYEVELAGEGRLAEAHYFGGYTSGQPRWGSGFFWSGQQFGQGFTPEPNAEERHYFSPLGGAAIDLTGVPLPGRGDWFFTPPPFCFAFQTASGWLGIGVEARPGEHRFTEYRYHGQRGFHLSLAYEGHTAISGLYRLPAIGFDFAADEFAALQAHVQALRGQGSGVRGQGSTTPLPPPAGGGTEGGAETRNQESDAGEGQTQNSKLKTQNFSPNPQSPSPIPHPPSPDWWYEPIFCGWGAQCHIAAREGCRAPECSRQELYELFLGTLDQRGVSPGVVVLDDKWQATYGENRADERKWPDLRGFIASQHARERRVLLWLKAWDPEGLPPEECIVNAAGLPLAFDPSNPAFERRLRASVRHMLAPAGYDADGFKIDFTARIPSGPGIRIHGDTWGLELMRRYLAIVYDETKRAKSDALIMTHTPHPYLADVLDMVRLNDMLDLNQLAGGVIGRDINATMVLRARIAAIACPDALIDTDNWPITDRAAWRAYMRLQPELGVPSLYFASHVDITNEPFDEEDYRLVTEVWQCYRSSRRRQKQR